MPSTRIQPASLSSNSEAPNFVGMATVVRLTGLGRSTIYRLIAEHKFPRPVKLGRRAIAWRRADLERWSEVRPEVAH